MSRALTARQRHIAAAVCADDNAPLTQDQIATKLGISPEYLSVTIRNLSLRMGLMDAMETGCISRIRLVVASRKAGGFDQLAASLGLLNRDLETVQ